MSPASVDAASLLAVVNGAPPVLGPTMDNRNATVHLKIKDGRTTAQHDVILSEIWECAYINPTGRA